ncbi:hypothetical protein ABK040_014914 [Willaertia magna]
MSEVVENSSAALDSNHFQQSTSLSSGSSAPLSNPNSLSNSLEDENLLNQSISLNNNVVQQIKDSVLLASSSFSVLPTFNKSKKKILQEELSSIQSSTLLLPDKPNKSTYKYRLSPKQRELRHVRALHVRNIQSKEILNCYACLYSESVPTTKEEDQITNFTNETLNTIVNGTNNTNNVNSIFIYRSGLIEDSINPSWNFELLSESLPAAKHPFKNSLNKNRNANRNNNNNNNTEGELQEDQKLQEEEEELEDEDFILSIRVKIFTVNNNSIRGNDHSMLLFQETAHPMFGNGNCSNGGFNDDNNNNNGGEGTRVVPQQLDENSDQLLNESVFRFDELFYVGNDMKELLIQQLPLNCILLELVDGIYISKETEIWMREHGILTNDKLPRSVRNVDNTSSLEIFLSELQYSVQKFSGLQYAVEEKKEDIEQYKELLNVKFEKQRRLIECKQNIELRRSRIQKLKQTINEKKKFIEEKKKELDEKKELLKQKHIQLVESQQELLEQKLSLSREQAGTLSTQKEELSILEQKYKHRQGMIVQQLSTIYMIGPHPQKQTNDLYINGLSICRGDQPISDEEAASALGFVAHCVRILSKLFQVPLRYQIYALSSRSFVSDEGQGDQNILLPLFMLRGSERPKYQKAIILLNLNILHILKLKGFKKSMKSERKFDVLDITMPTTTSFKQTNSITKPIELQQANLKRDSTVVTVKGHQSLTSTHGDKGSSASVGGHKCFNCSLRVSTISILVSMFTVMLLVFVGIITAILVTSFIDLERNEANSTSKRFLKAVSDEFTSFNQLLYSYSAWNYVYFNLDNYYKKTFSEQDMDNFLDEYFNGNMLKSTNVDFLVIYATDGTLIRSRVLDSALNANSDIKMVPKLFRVLPQFIIDNSKNPFYLNGGFIVNDIDNQLVLYNVAPITPTIVTNDTIPMGLFLNARYLGSKLLFDVAKTVQSCVSTHLWNDNTDDISNTFRNSLSNYQSKTVMPVMGKDWYNVDAFSTGLLTQEELNQRVCWSPNNERNVTSSNRFASYELIADVNGDPLFITRVDQPRNIYYAGLQTLLLAIFLLFGAFSNTRRNNEDNESSSQQNSFQGFTFGHTQLSGQNAGTTNNSIQLPNVGSSHGSSHAPVQSTTRNTDSHTPTTVLGEGNANDYLQSNFNNVNNNSGQQNSYDNKTNSSNRVNNTVPLRANNSVHNSDMIYNRPDYNPNPRSNTGFQFAINNSNSNPQTTRNNLLF